MFGNTSDHPNAVGTERKMVLIVDDRLSAAEFECASVNKMVKSMQEMVVVDIFIYVLLSIVLFALTSQLMRAFPSYSVHTEACLLIPWMR